MAQDKVLKGYTIPLVDISKETWRQIIVDREKGQYLGHPTTALLDDGHTILCVYPRSHGRGPVTMKRSTDGGLTWSERLQTPASWDTSLEVPTLYKTVDPDGKKHLIMFCGLYPIRMAHSEDDGNSWSELEPIGNYGGIVACSDLIDRGNGDYIALFHDDGRFIAPHGDFQTEVYVHGAGTNSASRIVYSSADGHGGWVPFSVWNSRADVENIPGTEWERRFVTKSDVEGNMQRREAFTVYAIRSTDGGLTWSEPTVVAHHNEALLCEAGIAHSPDGKRLAMLLRENGRHFNSFVCFSEDGGLTWSGLRELPGALTGDRHQVLHLPDGRLLISFRDMCHDTPTWGDWCAWVGTFEDIAEGREGQYRVRIMENRNRPDCAYPALELLPEGMVVVTTYGHWTQGEPAYIASVRFRMEELDAKL